MATKLWGGVEWAGVEWGRVGWSGVGYGGRVGWMVFSPAHN